LIVNAIIEPGHSSSWLAFRYVITSFCPLSPVSVVARDPTCLYAFLQECHQRFRSLCLSFARNLLNYDLHHALDQRAQDGIRVQANRTSHGDRPSQDADWIGPTGSDALGTSREVIDCWEMTAWHGTSMARSGPGKQPLPNPRGTTDNQPAAPPIPAALCGAPTVRRWVWNGPEPCG
jgi:hypothetical protein